MSARTGAAIARFPIPAYKHLIARQNRTCLMHTHSAIGPELASELATEILANSSFSVLSAALFLCGDTDSTSKAPIRYCSKCSTKMIHLSDLPSYKGAAPVRIFRCYCCNNVVSEDR